MPSGGNGNDSATPVTAKSESDLVRDALELWFRVPEFVRQEAYARDVPVADLVEIMVKPPDE
jgi:hypothetical protein